MQAANSTALDGFTNIPWQIKSLYGICSDTLPIRGFHRGPYITAAGFVGVSSWLLLGILPASAFLAAIFLFLANFSIASPDAVIDATVAKRCKSIQKFAADLQSLWVGYARRRKGFRPHHRRKLVLFTRLARCFRACKLYVPSSRISLHCLEARRILRR